jgi:AcrR family transcriptional regulator
MYRGGVNENAEVPPRSVGGRRRDASRDAALLDAAVAVLAEVGFERLTMDLVATRAKAGKATVYRRWPSKAHLVVDAVTRLGDRDVDLNRLPDTGTLRGDLVGLIRPEVLGGGNRELKVIAAVAAMHASVDDMELTRAASSASTRPWVTANRVLLQRALDRGEIDGSVDVDMASRLLPAMCLFRDHVEQVPLTAEFVTQVIDQLLLPGLGIRPS